MIDVVNQITATHREIGTGPVATGEGRSLLLRSYAAAIEDVWDIAAAIAFGVQHYACETAGDEGGQ